MTGTPRSVLLVEDDPDHALLLTSCLRRGAGYKVVGHAETGPDATTLAEAHQPDIVLLDLVLRESSGTTTIPGLMVAAPTAMIVAVSATRERAARDAALSAGAFAFVEKVGPLFEGTTMTELLDHLAGRFAAVLAGEEAVAPIIVRDARLPGTS